MFEINDNELMKRIKDGDHEAFACLVRRHTKYFYSITYRYVSNINLAEDLTQQAFLKVWEYPYKYDETLASFKTWFARLIINLCQDHNRKNSQTFQSFEDTDIAEETIEITEKLDEKRKHDVLEQAIKKLPLSQQTALNLGFYQEIPYNEVAIIMKTSEPAVKSLIMRAKENLKKYVKGENYV